MRRHKLDKKEVQNCKKLFSFFSKRKKEEGEKKKQKIIQPFLITKKTFTVS